MYMSVVYMRKNNNISRSQPSHFIPRFTTFNWGICLPAGCTHEDADQIISDGVRPYNSTGIKIHVEVEEDNCYVKHRKDYIQLLKNNWEITGTM